MAKKVIYELFSKENRKYKDYYIKAGSKKEARDIFIKKYHKEPLYISKVNNRLQKYHKDEVLNK